jgi:hypothetical protein
MDNTGCEAVYAYCNLNPSMCPPNTVCEGTTPAWSGDPSPCGGSTQCCWCTSDGACPVTRKCINDSSLHNCNGHGPCTGVDNGNKNFDAMHCQLTSPGIPMCAASFSCTNGNCNNVTSPAGTCSGAGTLCYCTADTQCAIGKCANWAGCAAGACTGSGTADGFNCVP